MQQDTIQQEQRINLPSTKKLSLKYFPALLGIYIICSIFYYFYPHWEWLLLIAAYATLCVITTLLKYSFNRNQASSFDHPDEERSFERIKNYHGQAMLISILISAVHIFALIAMIIYFFPDQTWLWWVGGSICTVLCIASLAVYFLLRRRVGELRDVLKDLENMKTP